MEKISNKDKKVVYNKLPKYELGNIYKRLEVKGLKPLGLKQLSVWVEQPSVPWVPFLEVFVAIMGVYRTV